MDILVLDTIHGGKEIAAALQAKGHRTDLVDVYRGEAGHATGRHYDLMIAPVHLDPGNLLLRSLSVPCITHHDAVRWILGDGVPEVFVEITGAQGKTTTAHALAHLMPGPGVLHTSSGTFRYPENAVLWRKSITPASVIPAARYARKIGGWCIAEVSLGFTGAGTLGILTSPGDYPCAGSMKRALDEKVRSAAHCRCILTASGVSVPYPWACAVDDIARSDGISCSVTLGNTIRDFSNGLLALESYRTPLMLAASSASLMGIDPGGLATFQPVGGRMSVSGEGLVRIIDNANSGTNCTTTEEAVNLARSHPGNSGLTLVIGMDARAVCEGFPPEEIAQAIRSTRPERVVLVGDLAWEPAEEVARSLGIPVSYAGDLSEGRQIACSRPGLVVLAVKTWR
ncbi:MAG: coenzyme F430 synthase [Methanoregulaceae archaeon]|nr:coenzyme F430 synthase [Methanoregulaceae archaeon]